MNLADHYGSNPVIKKIVDNREIGHQEAANLIAKHGATFSEAAVRRLRSKIEPVAEEGTTSLTKGTVDIDSDGCQINNVVVNSPILDDWGPVFELFNLDPNTFEVVDDTVKMSTWQQSKGAEDGTRDTIQLYSYSARFRRVKKEMIPASVVKEWRDGMISHYEHIPYERRIAIPEESGEKATYTVLIADPQLGKKGTDEAVYNWQSGLLEHSSMISTLLAEGSPIERIHVAFMGDETENCMGNYANQPATIELNRSQQLELDYDLTVWTLKMLGNLGLPLSVSSVISNHGEWTRWGMSKEVVTSKGDNASTYIRRQARKLFDELEPFGGPKIDWTIGGGAPGVTVNLSGVDAYFSHGYVERGKGATTEARMQNAVERQILGDTEGLGAVPLWFMAHYHHFYTNEFQDRTLFGCPALEAEKSSDWIRESSGIWSPAGMLGLVVGCHTARGWSDLNIF